MVSHDDGDGRRTYIIMDTCRKIEREGGREGGRDHAIHSSKTAVTALCHLHIRVTPKAHSGVTWHIGGPHRENKKT